MKQYIENPGGGNAPVNLYAAEFMQYAFHFAAPDKDSRKINVLTDCNRPCSKEVARNCARRAAVAAEQVNTSARMCF
jgi:hypothetical protein